VEAGSTVTIVVSSGAASVTVEDVIGQSEDAAIGALEGQGLKVAVDRQPVTSPSEDGRVIDQSPPGGTRVQEGDTVTIVVGELEKPAKEPKEPKEPPPVVEE
jgi:serine/threonine-protein kinase